MIHLVTRHLQAIAGPLLAAQAFARLSRVTFLGILSPRYNQLPGAPHTAHRNAHDGTRADHSIGVAAIVLSMADTLSLSLRAKRYATAWALTHDLATWPLSHTGDAAFSRTTELQLRYLRREMIEGSYRLPDRLKVLNELRYMQVDADTLLALFDRDTSGLDLELELLRQIIHSPITPDTLEGMARSGSVFGVDVPNPDHLISAVYRDVFSHAVINHRQSASVLKFWRAKSKIYDTYINNWRSIEFESAWTLAIEDAFQRLSLDETLELSEPDLIAAVLMRGTPRFRNVRRYKNPLTYTVSPELTRKRRIGRNVRVEDLRSLLTKSERHL